MEKREILKETELFVLDMDGTFYLDTDVLDGALDFLEEVKKAGKRYVFFTNNSSKSPKTYIDKLAKMGCYIKGTDHYIRGCDDSVSERVLS